MKPSRTYTLGIVGVFAQLALAAAGLVVWFAAPGGEANALIELLAELGMYAAACAGGGAGAMAVRDYGSGGLTSSQGDQVLASAAHHVEQAGAEGAP